MSPEPGPQIEGVQVTARNWQDPPGNRWAFWHAGDLLPAYRVACGPGPARALHDPAGPAARPVDVTALPLTRVGGLAGTVGDVLDGTFTDAYVVLHGGELAAEWYNDQGAADRVHALMSVSKSVVGCVAAVLIDRGSLEPERSVTDYVPELADSGYAGATVRHILDMRSGVRFAEEYANPQADINRLDEWVGAPGTEARGLYRFLATLPAEGAHGGPFQYRSVESDVLGWVCERAAGQPMAALESELVWAPMGAEHDALLLHDGLGTAVHDGGLCATARDVARFGQLLLDGGSVPSASGGPAGSRGGARRRVVPPSWLQQAWAVDADIRGAFAASPAEPAFPGGWYRNQFWFRPGAFGDVLLGLGIYGQMLHVSRHTNTVCVKFSSWPQPQNPVYLEDTLRAFDTVGGALAGWNPGDPDGRLAGTGGFPGLVSGLTRHGGAGSAPAGPPAPLNVI